MGKQNEERKCENCGKKLKKDQKRFCSRNCYHKFLKKKSDEIKLMPIDKIKNAIMPVIVLSYAVSSVYVIFLAISLPKTYSWFLRYIFVIGLVLFYLLLTYFLYERVFPRLTTNEKYKKIPRTQHSSFGTLIKIVGALALLVSLQAAHPVFLPKVSLTPIEDTFGVVDGDDHYVTTSS